MSKGMLLGNESRELQNMAVPINAHSSSLINLRGMRSRQEREAKSETSFPDERDALFAVTTREWAYGSGIEQEAPDPAPVRKGT